MHAAEFFLVTLPGLEDLVLAEVKEWFPEFEHKPEYGGVTVFAPLSEGLAMNLALKTPTRILVRVTRFRCKDFPKLFRTVNEFPWHQWVDVNCDVEVHAAAKKSRVKIKSRIEDTCQEAWAKLKRRTSKTKASEAKLRLYVRFIDNECTLSLDTSGERLHKRGIRQHIGEAPLRETIAASLLQLVGRLSGPEPIELVDPMMGSGTFLLEALGRDRLVDAREFAFERFASQPTERPRLRAERATFHKLIGFEQDIKSCEAAKHNFDLDKDLTKVELFNQDFFKSAPLASVQTGHQRWVLCNPPYGERLQVEGPLREYYQTLFEQVERVARPDRACFLLPAKAVHGKFLLPAGWKVLEKRRFLNGGIPVVAFVFGRTEQAVI